MLTQQVADQIKEAMKAKDTTTLSTLRMLKASFTNREIEVGHPLSDEEALSVVKSQVKQVKDTLEAERTAGRQAEADAAAAELQVLERYMPAQLSDEQVHTLVQDALAQAGITAKADMGRAMGVAMKAVAGQADGGRVKAAVESLLAVIAVLGICLLLPQVVLAAPVTSSSAVTFIPVALRAARAFLLLIGIVCVNMILMGGFDMMVASGRMETQSRALGKMSGGLIGSLIVAALFSAFTVVLGDL